MFRKPNAKPNNQAVNKNWIIQLVQLIEIRDRSFWHNNAKGSVKLETIYDKEKQKELPVGIITIQNILKSFMKDNPDLFTNEQKLNEMLQIFRAALTDEVMNQDKEFPNACQIYKLIHSPSAKEVEALHELRPLLLDYALIHRLLYSVTGSKEPGSLNDHTKRFNKFVKQLEGWFNERPRLLLLLDYIVHENANGQFGNRRTALEAYTSLSTYVRLASESQNANMFLQCCGINSPEALAICLRHECYVACTYSKDGRNILEDDRFHDYKIRRQLETINERLIKTATRPEIFNQLFKNIDDILQFANIMNQHAVNFGYALGHAKTYGDNYNHEIFLIGQAMINNPVMMEELANHPEKRAALFKAAPVLEEIVQNRAKSNVSVGLMFSKKHAAEGNPIRRLPKELARKIADHAAEEMGSPQKKGPGGKK